MTNTTGMSAGRPSARTGASSAKLQSILGGDDDKLVRVNFEIPQSKRTAFKIYAATQNKTMGEILAEHIDTLLNGR